MRAQAWLYFFHTNIPKKTGNDISIKEIQCTQSQDIKQDVLRSHCFHEKYSAASILETRRRVLESTLNQFFSETQYNYFQGCHSIASVLLTITDQHSTLHLLKCLASTLLIEPFSTPHQTDACCHAMMIKLAGVDSALRHFIDQSGIPILFSLSWLTTGFAHHLDKLSNIARVYDWWFEHADEPDALQWLGVALLVSHRSFILSYECNLMLLPCLTKLPHDELDWDALIVQAERYRRLNQEQAMKRNVTMSIMMIFVVACIWTIS